MALGPKTRFNSNTFGIEPHTSEYTIKQDSGVLPASHSNLLVHNIGRTEVTAKLKYGTWVNWFGVADEAVIQPGEIKIIQNWGRPYYVTWLKITNDTDVRAVVHCATADDEYYLFATKESGAFNNAKNKLLRSLFTLGVKYVPYVGSGLSGLVVTFWPDKKPNAWEQVQDKVQTLVSQTVLDAIKGILSGKIREYQEKISTLLQEVEDGADSSVLSDHYMSIAYALVGFEKNFNFPSDIHDYQNVNQYILPLFSTTVLMKISFYVIGMKQAEQFGLTDDQVGQLKLYADRAINDENGANKYITDLYKDRVDHTYKKILAEDLYDNMMNVRTFIATQGLEYIRIWNYMLENLSDEGVYNDVISYSTFFGRQTARLIQQATLDELSEPLTPSLVDGKRNKISFIDVYIWRINNGTGASRIGGMKIEFENGNSYILGTVSNEIKTVQFDGALLVKLEVFGGGAIDYLAFYFSDDRVETVGEKGLFRGNTTFELKGHHIVSIFMSSDNWSLGGQAANISVAYKLTEKSEE